MLKNAGFSQSNIKTFSFNPSEIITTFRNRLGKQTKEQETGFSRVETSYALNESLTKSSSRRKIKSLLNGTLNFLSAGDSLKIKAVK